MRIITGKHRGRKIISPTHEGVRPTTDRIKENVFNIIREYIPESICLDLFAGTGGLGFECISRGASQVYFVDNSKESIKDISATAKSLGEKPYIILSDYNVALKNLNNQGIKFDVIFIDPPYRTMLAEYALDKLTQYDMLNEGGIIIWESLAELKKPDNYKCAYTHIDRRNYGETQIDIYYNER
jgi:16S rRNA (guanine(966)-N(2))-methyltransferase RsmD